MCGIVAYLRYHPDAPPLDKSEVIAVRDAMRVRGPDDAGFWQSADRRVILAHRRLSIIDLSSAGAQPMADTSGRYHIVFNGEIYNYRALRLQLESAGYSFRCTTDTEVLLNLYKARGRDMLCDLRGMFAFAIWDETERVMFVARDAFGIKPLYYTLD